jgi:hypothetical protein
MPLLKRHLTKEDCEKWELSKKKNPDSPKNPITNYKVAYKSLVYKEIDKQCNSDVVDEPRQEQSPKQFANKPKTIPVAIKDLTLEHCLYWDKNKNRNPITTYVLKENSKILKEIQSKCIPMLEEYHKNLPKNTNLNVSDDKSITIPRNQPEVVETTPYITNSDDLIYPELDDVHFNEKIAQLYYLYKVPKYENIKDKKDFEDQSNKLCGDFEKTLYQYFISNYISSRTPYKSILLYHGVGVGKTCSAISLAEGFLVPHSMYEEPKIWVIMPLALKNSFKEQIFSLANYENYAYLANQCTGDLYIKMAQLLRDTHQDKAQQKIKKLIKSRYRIFTYDAFATFIETEYIAKNKVPKDKVVIVDEAHNIRSVSSNENEKRVYSSLTFVAENGVNNRLALLSATPMYNKAEDIFDLLHLLLLNDKRTNILNQPFPSFFNDNNVANPKAMEIIKTLSKNYISYLKGKNPFTFALKLSPKVFGDKKTIRLLSHEFKKDSNNKVIPASFNNWLAKIEDGIVISDLGEHQIKYISTLKNGTDDNNVFNNLQPMNIVYDNAIGEKGFNTIFSRTGQNGTLSVNYNKKYNDALYPDKDNLGKYSGKFLNICNIVKNSTGIVVIYSSYIWSGIIPLAIALEHMGFNREGSQNILKNPKIIPDAPKYGAKTSPKYCILSSDNSEIMGSSSIDNLIKKINNINNIDGSQIKVILMTPVASEGLSFYNIREMHIVEPWFHFNKVSQVIGRGIRNCRHQNLPLEDRNVTVFMHASYNDDDKETADIHSFRIASKKYIQTSEIDAIIRDNAIDCSLMRNINYFPKSLFEFGKLTINTSQNIKIDYSYGDNQSDEPKCNAKIPDPSSFNGYRKDTYKHFIIAIQNQIRKIILQEIHNNVWYVPNTKILDIVGFNKKITYQAINESVYPNTLIDGYILIPHENGIHIVKIEPRQSTRIKILNEEKVEQKEVVTTKCSKNKLQTVSKKGIDEATLALYLSLNSECFEELLKSFIGPQVLSQADEYLAECLYKQGALISNKEFQIAKNKQVEYKYIGYVNVFNPEFEAYIYIPGDNRQYRQLIDREIEQIKAKRMRIEKPEDITNETQSWGVITPIKDKKTGFFTNVLKLLIPGPSKGAKTGIVCSSVQKVVQDNVLQQLGTNEKYSNKNENCHHIALQLIKNKRITFYPEYKPLMI